MKKLQQYLCKLGYHSWTYQGITKWKRLCDVCGKVQIEDWTGSGEWLECRD